MTELQTLANVATDVLRGMEDGEKPAFLAELRSVHNTLIDLVVEPEESEYYQGEGFLDLDEALQDLQATLQELDAQAPESAQEVYTRPVHAVVDTLIAMGALA